MTGLKLSRPRRKISKWLSCLALCLCMVAPLQAATYAALVMDAQTGRVIHGVRPDTLVYPASLTKMMTLYLVFQALEKGKLKLSDKIHVTSHAARQPPCKLGLRPGDSLTVQQAILGLVTKSANDASEAIAVKLGGTPARFAQMMSQKARELGLHHTTFRNASGLFHREQQTTARDMARLGLILMRHFPREYKYFKTRHFVFRGQSHKNHNQLLGQFGCDGLKTGYLCASGWNQVASAQMGSRRYIVCVIGGQTRIGRDRKIQALLKAAFHAPKTLPKVLGCAPPKASKAPRPVVHKAQSLIDQLLAQVDRTSSENI
jgi:D-alanyl-D-alanine carboxypeptidase